VADRNRANGRIPEGNSRSRFGLVNPANRPKCLQSALDVSPSNLSTSAFAARVLIGASRTWP
jgi:hypothetical protein